MTAADLTVVIHPVARGENWVDVSADPEYRGVERVYWLTDRWSTIGTPQTNDACALSLGAQLAGDDRRSVMPAWHPQAVKVLT